MTPSDADLVKLRKAAAKAINATTLTVETEDEHIAAFIAQARPVVILSLLARIEALAARVAKLEGALNQAAEWFEGYEVGHRHKGDVDKETRNGNRARFCRRAALGEAE